jgi:hypothetical protein
LIGNHIIKYNANTEGTFVMGLKVKRDVINLYSMELLYHKRQPIFMKTSYAKQLDNHFKNACISMDLFRPAHIFKSKNIIII